MQILKKGKSYIFTFPFFIYAKFNSLEGIKINYSDDTVLRFYPLYRQSEANFIFMPHIKISKTPFLKKPNAKSTIYKLPKLAAIPRIDRDKDGKFQILLAWSEKFEEKIDPFPYDSLRVDVYGPLNENEIKEIVKRLIKLIRWKTKQWWIDRTTADLFGNMRGNFDIDKNGTPNKEAYGYSPGRTVTGIEKELNNEIWKHSINLLMDNTDPVFHENLFLDSVYYKYSNDLKLAVFHLAISCEQALEYFSFKKWQKLEKAKKYKKTRIYKGDNLLDHVDFGAKSYFGNSFKDDYPEDYANLKILWLSRNSIAHGGNLEIYLDGELLLIEQDLFKSISNSVEKLIKWLELQLEN